MLNQCSQKLLNLNLNLNLLALHLYEGLKKDFEVIREIHILKVEGDWSELSEKFAKIILDKVFRTNLGNQAKLGRTSFMCRREAN